MLQSTAEVKINAVAYAAEQALALSYQENDVIESITGPTPARASTTGTTENTVPGILFNNVNQAKLTNLNKRPYKAPNKHVGTKYV